MQIPSAAAIIRDADGRVLLLKSANEDVWGLPAAGAIDLGETTQEAVVREVFEETNLRVNPVRISSVFGGKDFRFTYSNGDGVEYFTVVFECEISGGELFARVGEISAFQYFAPEELPELVIPYPKLFFSINNSSISNRAEILLRVFFDVRFSGGNADASREMFRFDFDKLRYDFLTIFNRVWTARVKRTARRRIYRAWNIAFQNYSRPFSFDFGVRNGNGGNQGFCVRH